MSHTRRKYDPEFRAGAVRIVRETRRPIAEIAHSVGEYVRGPVSTNGIENFWSGLKRTHIGTYHYWSDEHLHRYVEEHSFRYNNRSRHVTERMAEAAQRMEGRTLAWRELVAR